MGKSKYTYEVCYQIAKGCNTRTEFQKKCHQACYMARRNGWLDDYTWFKTKTQANSDGHKGLGLKYTYDVCFKEASKYTQRSRFKEGSYSIYVTACRNKWLKDYTWFRPTSEVTTKWTKEACLEEAKKYHTRWDFGKNNGSAYNSALRNGWIDELFPQSLDMYGNCDNVYRYYFKDFNAVYVGRTVRPKCRDLEHIYLYKKDTVAKFIRANGIPLPPMEILETNVSLKEGQRLEGYYIDLYREQGYTILNKAKSGALGTIKLKR